MLIATILLGSALLGAATINNLSFWFDEILSIDGITDYGALARRLPEQMPAYYVLLRGWVSLVGESEVAARWLSLLLGLVALAVTYLLARRYTVPHAAVWSLIVLGSSAFFVRYYHEMRPYTLLACFSTLSMWFYLKWIHRGNYRDALYWLLASIAMLYTHYFSALLIATQGIYFLYYAKPIRILPRLGVTLTRQRWLTLGIFLMCGLVLLPNIQSSSKTLSVIVKYGRVIQALNMQQAVNSTVQTLTNDSPGLFLLLAALALIMRWKGVGIAAVWLFVPLLTTLFIHGFVVPILVNPRYLIFIWPAMAILVGLGVATLERFNPRAAYTAILIVAMIGIAQVMTDLSARQPGVLTDQPWREMTSTIARNGRSDDMLIVNMVDPVGTTGYRKPLFYYLNRNIPFSMPAPFELDLTPTPDPATLTPQFATAQGVWFMVTDGPANARGETTMATLHDNGYARCRNWQYGHGTSLTEWQHIGGETVSFGDLISVVKTPLNRLDQPMRAGAEINLAVGLTAMRSIPLDYSVAVHLLNSDNVMIAQSDGAPAGSRTSTWKSGENYCDVHHITLPQQPGVYRILVAIYDSQTGARLTSTTPTGLSDSMIVLQFTIEK